MSGYNMAMDLIYPASQVKKQTVGWDEKIFRGVETKKQRCEGCRFKRTVYAQGGFSFFGCYYRPYIGKRCAEIKDCPKQQMEGR